MDDLPDKAAGGNFGVRIKAWTCPVPWHRYVKWHGCMAFCIEPGCDRSNVEEDETPVVARVTVVPHSVVTIHLPDAK